LNLFFPFSFFLLSFFFLSFFSFLFLVGTGVFQALRAVLVFGLSGFLFCDLEKSQCFTVYKAISTAVVSMGVVSYSMSAKSQPQDLPLFVASKNTEGRVVM